MAESEPTKESVVPLSPLAQRAMTELRARLQREMQEILELEVQGRDLPEGTQFDPARGVFVLPE